MRRLLLALLCLALLALGFLLPGRDAAHSTFWSVAPPLLAIGLALIARDVLLSLVLGVWLGTSMIAGGNPALGFLDLIDTEVRDALTDSDHMSIILFSLLLGGMVGVMSRSGGTQGVVRLLEPLATTPQRAQVATWMMGVSIFFDDYSNTLIVGNAMRPVTDRHSVSREKLAFLVDSTAAPVACVVLVSTWIGYQVSILGDVLVARGSDLNPIAVFLASVPKAYYPFFALTLTLSIAVSGRDWGAMLRAEQRARRGHVLAPDAIPLADYESSGLAPEEGTPRLWWNAALPVLVVVAVTLVGLYVTGRNALIEAGAVDPPLRDVVGQSDPFTVLLWASLCGIVLAVLLAVSQSLLSLRESLEAAVAGFKSMLMAVVVLTLAWSLGSVCEKLGTADFLVGLVGEHLPAGLVPASVFCVAAAVSFATGTSWGTMGILTPLAVPLALAASGPDGHVSILAATVSAILGGSVFGDHCSPISDTTIMSSMASGCDHVDHVRTQLPYALLAAGVALALGYLPDALGGAPSWLLLVLGATVIVGWTRLLGRTSGPA